MRKAGETIENTEYLVIPDNTVQQRLTSPGSDSDSVGRWFESSRACQIVLT